MSFYEAPHTDMFERDLHEVIRLYDHLTRTYDSLLHDLRDLRFRLDDYVRKMQKEIPLEVDKRIRIYEQRLEKYRKECENNYANIVRIVDSYQKRTDSQIDAQNKEIKKWHEHLDKHEQYLVKLIQEMQKSFDRSNAELRDAFDEFVETTNIRMDAWRLFARGLDYENRRWTERLVAELEDKVQEIVREDSTIVWNPYRGDYTSLGIFIMDMWRGVVPVPWGYTCKEWHNDTEVTCQVWNRHKDMTCLDWYIKGKIVFHWKERKERINSWISGKKVYWRQAIREIYPLLFKLLGAIKAGDYDSWNISAEEYEQLQITAREYDFGIAREELEPEGDEEIV